MVMQPIIIPAAAHAAATSTAPMAPSFKPSRISRANSRGDSFLIILMIKEEPTVAVMAQNTARSGEKLRMRK